jgi:fatty acid desaturase
MLWGVATRKLTARRRGPGSRSSRNVVVWLGAAVLAVALLGAAWAAETYPLPGTGLLLPAVALLLWYRIRFIP